ncbi:MAG: acetate kinase, partial [Acidobacteriota bacterium]|nr:acetate kinase [Acidobacteriota bacterium]
KKYIGAYYAALGRVDALVFTAGIGENSPLIRGMCCEGLEELGIELDKGKNEERSKANRDISTADSRVKILVIPTNEEKRIARETKRILMSRT